MRLHYDLCHTSYFLSNPSLAAPELLPHRLQHPIWKLEGRKMADGVWKGVYPKVFERSCQLSLYKFFDLSTPSSNYEKGHDGGKK